MPHFSTLLLAFTVLAAPSSAQIVVTSTVDVVGDDGACTLREAIVAANTDSASGASAGECAAGSGADEVRIATPPGATIVLTADLPTVTQTWALVGPTGRADGVTIDGGGQYRVFELDSNGQQQTHTLRGLTVTGGLAPNGGGIAVGYQEDCVFEHLAVVGNVADAAGGGIYTGSEGTCDMDHLYVADNEVLQFASGGGIRVGNSGSATIRNSTIAGNRAPQSGGGGILVGFYSEPEATFVLEQSTVSGNTAEGGGGGISINGVAGTVTIRHSTIVGNHVTGATSAGGGVQVSGDVTFESSIVAGNTAVRGEGEWDDLSLGVNRTTSMGGNVIGINGFFATEFPVGAPNANGDLVGNVETPLDALLAPLADTGGLMPTHLPMPGSPVLDAGVCPGGPSDQRGGAREVDEPDVSDLNGDACDAGAVEGLVSFVDAEPGPVAGASLGLPEPNPSARGARLTVQLDRTQPVEVVLFDVRGRRLAVLADDVLSAGEHVVRLPDLRPGVYLVRLATAGDVATRRVTVVR